MRKDSELESKPWCASKPQIDHLNMATEHAQRLSQSQQGVKLLSNFGTVKQK